MGCDRFVECGSLLPLSKAAASRRTPNTDAVFCACRYFVVAKPGRRPLYHASMIGAAMKIVE